MRFALRALTAGFIAILAGNAGRAQEMVDKISFETVDGVLIKGSFYPSAKGSNSPVVMLMHKYGSDRTKGGWDELAKHLQAQGFAVMSFDFRGHGESTSIKPEKFWSFAYNRQHMSNVNSKNKTISFKNFKNGYFPILVNDIVSARWDLDNRNDNGQCNTSNVIVIAAEEGASLAFLWMTFEYLRPAIYSQTNPLLKLGGGVNIAPASDDLAGAIWLSYVRSPQRVNIPYGALMSIAKGVRDHVPMWFAVGKNDKPGMDDTNYMYDNVLRADQKRDRLELTFKKPIENTQLRGAQLLAGEKLTTNADIDKYLKKVVEKRPNSAQKRRNASESMPVIVPLSEMGFNPNNYP